jgi:acyl-CoA reductase-like NAD-dependent aldehyde dehydrogenase
MRYCTDCGNGHDCTAESRESAESDEVKIARINREADVAIAKLAARVQRDELATVEEVAEVEADAMVEAAVAEAEVVGAAIEAGIEPEPEPVIIDAPEAIAEDEPDDAPPEVEGSEPPAAAKRKVGLGAW